MAGYLLLCLPLLPVRAEDWTTKDGKTYESVTVVKLEADEVSILDKDGGARVPLSNLPGDLQKRFNYDPAKAKIAAEARAKKDAVNASALQEEINQANAIKARQQIQDSKLIDQASKTTATARDLDAEGEWEKAQIIKKEDEANGYAHASGRIIQVISEGFLGNISTRWGIYDPCFVKCDSKDMIDGQTWTGIVIPQHTFQYTTTLGAQATIPAFTTNLKETPSSPVASNYIAPPRPVSSMRAVGGD